MSILRKIDDYNAWRDDKLTRISSQLKDYWVEINNPFTLSKSEKNKIINLCQCGNFALFKLSPQKDYQQAIIAINQQLGLLDFDHHLYAQDSGIARITQSQNTQQDEFIPYTNKAIGWHTDGYYNPIAQRVRCFSLFCITPAQMGGENTWIDPQMVYLLLREANPDIAKALTHPQAMSIPEHKINATVLRGKSVGSIFFIDEKTATLSMRYSQRKKYITLFNSTEIKQAVAHLDNLLAQTNDYHFTHLMQSGEGMICNNILHKRTSFTDNPNKPRLLLRGRYFNKISYE